jgi:hypothetical protein
LQWEEVNSMTKWWYSADLESSSGKTSVVSHYVYADSEGEAEKIAWDVAGDVLPNHQVIRVHVKES